MTKEFRVSGDRCPQERKAYADANSAAITAMEAMRAAIKAVIAAELAECGIEIGSPVVAKVHSWRTEKEEPGILRRYDHNGVTVAKRKKDGTAHATHTIYGVVSIRLDVTP